MKIMRVRGFPIGQVLAIVMTLALSLLVEDISALGVATDPRPTCAVLTFEAGDNVDAGVPARLCNKFAGLLAETGKYQVVPRVNSNTILSEKHFNRAGHSSETDAGIAAGKLLGTDYVVTGKVGLTIEGFVLSVSLVDVKAGKIVKTGKMKPTSDSRELASDLPQSAVEFLAGPMKTSAVVPVPNTQGGMEKKVAGAPASTPAPDTEIRRDEPATSPAIKTTLEPITELSVNAAATAENNPQGVSSASTGRLDDQWREVERYLAGHLQVGTRVTGVMLLEDTSDSFVGSINKLNEAQSYWPTKLYADWFFTRNWGIELTWDKVRAETATEEKEDSPSHYDGDWIITGPILSAIGRYPNASEWVPYGGLGLAFMSATFDHATWWHTGFSSEEDWVAAGSPGTSSSDYWRTMAPDDAVGYVAFGGCDYRITDNLLADFYLRYMRVEIDNNYYLTRGGSVDDRGWNTIPLHNIALGLGIAYAF